MTISAEERIRQLIELENAKKKEVEDRKQELEKKEVIDSLASPGVGLGTMPGTAASE